MVFDKYFLANDPIQISIVYLSAFKLHTNNCLFNRLLGPPSTWVIATTFTQADEESIYGRLYKNNMDGLNSFFPTKIALGLVVSKDSHAFFNDEPIYSFKQHHCKVKFIQFKID